MDKESIDKDTLFKLLDTEYKVYSYLTIDNEPGTVITDRRLEKVFDDNKFFTMDNVKTSIIKLRDIIEKGYISVGSVDLMDSVRIVCPHPDLNLKSKISGRYMHGSRKAIISNTTNIEFSYEPDSDVEDEADEIDDAYETGEADDANAGKREYFAFDIDDDDNVDNVNNVDNEDTDYNNQPNKEIKEDKDHAS